MVGHYILHNGLVYIVEDYLGDLAVVREVETGELDFIDSNDMVEY